MSPKGIKTQRKTGQATSSSREGEAWKTRLQTIGIAIRPVPNERVSLVSSALSPRDLKGRVLDGVWVLATGDGDAGGIGVAVNPTDRSERWLWWTGPEDAPAVRGSNLRRNGALNHIAANTRLLRKAASQPTMETR